MLSGRSGLFVKTLIPAGPFQHFPELYNFEVYIIFSYLVEWIFKVILNIVQANQNEAENYRCKILQTWTKVLCMINKIWCVKNRKTKNKYFAVCS